MARLIYAFLALSLGTLVAGFLIRDSSIPLLVSIGLSALVLLLILVGTSRRLRRSQALEDEQEELASLEIVEIDEPDVAEATDTAGATAATPRPRRKPSARRRSIAADTEAMDALEAGVEPEETEVTEVVEPRPLRKVAKPRPPRRKAGTIVEPDSPPEYVMDDTVAEETVADAEPPLTIEMPPPRKAARPRRRAAAEPAESTTRGSAIAEPTAAIERPVLAPKVWVIPGRSRYHTQDCRFAKGDTLREVTETTAIRRGYVACNVCKPGAA